MNHGAAIHRAHLRDCSAADRRTRRLLAADLAYAFREIGKALKDRTTWHTVVLQPGSRPSPTLPLDTGPSSGVNWNHAAGPKQVQSRSESGPAVGADGRPWTRGI